MQPPMAEGHRVPHDSTIVKPGIAKCKGKDKGKKRKGAGEQMHWEFVVPGVQLYPELIVGFTYGA